MYTGTLINELFATVERAESRAREAGEPAETGALVCDGAPGATTYGTEPSWSCLMAAASQPIVSRRRVPCWIGTPEIYFAKAIDNTRLVKVEDPRREREMRQFGIALSCLFLLVMTYAWQHFKAIEYGYKIESLKIERDGMIEMNHELRLEDASLRDPERIDAMARKLGLQSPQAGQVLRLEGAADAGTPVMASVLRCLMSEVSVCRDIGVSRASTDVSGHGFNWAVEVEKEDGALAPVRV